MKPCRQKILMSFPAQAAALMKARPGRIAIAHLPAAIHLMHTALQCQAGFRGKQRLLFPFR